MRGRQGVRRHADARDRQAFGPPTNPPRDSAPSCAGRVRPPMAGPLVDGLIAVVTGGAGGIGGGITRRLADEGATVVVNDIDGDLLDATVANVRTAGGTVVPVVGDIRDAATVAELHRVASEVD